MNRFLTGNEWNWRLARTIVQGIPGGADGGEIVPGGSSGNASGNLPMPRYRAAIMRGGEKVWLNWCEGLYCTDGCGDTFAGIEGVGIVDVEIDPASIGGGWYVKSIVDGKLIGLRVYYLTPDSASTGYYAAYYRVHWMGAKPAWGKWETDDDDDGAGNDRDLIDMIELTICPC